MKLDTQKMQKELQKDGSILKGLRCTVGLGAGLIAGGIVFLGFGAPIVAVMLAAGLWGAALVVTVGFGAPGGLLVWLGMRSKKKQRTKWLEYYMKSTGYAKEELEGLEGELQAPDMVVIGNRRVGEGKKAAFAYFFITKNYIVMPTLMGESYIRRIKDIVGVAYSQRIPGYNGTYAGLLVLSTKEVDDNAAQTNGFLDRESCMNIVNELLSRNPSVITDHVFKHEGKVYDMLQDGRAIIKLQLEHRLGQVKETK